jgi:GxxExxY protein
MELLHRDITGEIIGAAFEVYKQLGYGFLESVYQKAMKVELESRGLVAELESPIKVFFKGFNVGDFEADIFVNQSVIVELKVAKEYQKADDAQLLNELKATRIKVG